MVGLVGALLLSFGLGPAAPLPMSRTIQAPASASSLVAANADAFAHSTADPDLAGPYFGARYYAASTARFTSVDPAMTSQANLTDPQRWIRYAYARNNPLTFVDPDGRVIETAWDVFNIGLGVASLGYNLAEGNWGSAAFDAGGLVLDGVAAAVPFVPGGAGAAIKAGRIADKTVDAARVLDAAADGTRAAKGGTAAANWAENVAKGIPESALGPSGSPRFT
jgi:RHS repeat-associated protein